MHAGCLKGLVLPALFDRFVLVASGASRQTRQPDAEHRHGSSHLDHDPSL
jgi:hypothetical protein